MIIVTKDFGVVSLYRRGTVLSHRVEIENVVGQSSQETPSDTLGVRRHTVPSVLHGG